MGLDSTDNSGSIPKPAAQDSAVSGLRMFITAALLGGFFLASFVPTAAKQFSILDGQLGQAELLAEAQFAAAEKHATQEADTIPTEDKATGTSATNTPESTQSSSSNDTSVTRNGSSTSISIQSSTKSTSEGTSSGPSVVVNGDVIDVPKNGRFSETYENGDSKTRIRTRIDSDSSGSASINISTNEQVEVEAD